MNVDQQLLESTRLHVLQLAGLESLLAALRPHPSYPLWTRRYWVLRELLPEDESALRILSDPLAHERRRDDLIASAEALALPSRFQIQRALALLYWQWATHGESTKLTDHARVCYRLAGRLWQRLLIDTEFWDCFAADHDIDAEHVARVREDVCVAIFNHHLEEAKQCLLRKDISGCQFHLRSISQWTAAHLRQSDGNEDVASANLCQELTSKAESLLSAWISDFLRRAKERQQNPKSRLNLPDGISRDFEGALNTVQPVLQSFPDNARLLSFCVEEYGDYATELRVSEREEEALKIARKGAYLARYLAEQHLVPGDAANADNRLVCQAFIAAANVETDAGKQRTWLELYQKWGGDSPNIEFNILYAEAVEACNDERYTDALDALDRITDSNANLPHTVDVRVSSLQGRAQQNLHQGQEMMCELARDTRRVVGALQSSEADGPIAEIRALFQSVHTDLHHASNIAPQSQSYKDDADSLTEQANSIDSYSSEIHSRVALQAAEQIALRVEGGSPAGIADVDLLGLAHILDECPSSDPLYDFSQKGSSYLRSLAGQQI